MQLPAASTGLTCALLRSNAVRSDAPDQADRGDGLPPATREVVVNVLPEPPSEPTSALESEEASQVAVQAHPAAPQARPAMPADDGGRVGRSACRRLLPHPAEFLIGMCFGAWAGAIAGEGMGAAIGTPVGGVGYSLLCAVARACERR